MSDNKYVHNIMGQGRVNQLGGTYINGRPLPLFVRNKIVEMSKRNIKPCEISRELRISHGAVSKILNRFHETGSITPGQIGGNPRQRLSIQSVEKDIAAMNQANPDISAQEIQQTLVELNICTRVNVPTVSSINRHLKARGLVKKRSSQKLSPANLPTTPNGLWLGPSTQQQKTPPTPPSNQKLKFSVDNILNLTNEQQEEEANVNDQQQASFSDERSESEASTPVSRSRTYFTPEQVEFLEKSYDSNPYPDQEQKEKIAKSTNLSECRVQVWFSNRRARQRKSLTNNTIFTAENLLHSAAIQHHQQQQTQQQQMLSPINPLPAPQPIFNQPLAATNYPSFQQHPITILNYLQQQRIYELYAAALNQQKQQSKIAP